MKLIQGQTNARIEIEVDMLDGGQELESLLEQVTITIEYLYKNYDSDDDIGTWTADGYFMDGDIPVVYYNFKGLDAVPDDCRHLSGRVVVDDGRIVKGQLWSIVVQPDELA